MHECQELSSVSGDEYAEIIGSLIYLNNDTQFQCNEYNHPKWAKLSDIDFKRQKEKMQLINYCLKTAEGLPTPAHKYGSLIFKRCPCFFYNPEISTLSDLSYYFETYGPSDQLYMYNTKEISAKLYQYLKIITKYYTELKQAAEAKKLKEANKTKKNKV